MGHAETQTLEILRKNGEAYQSSIVRSTGLSPATVSEVLSSLERRKLIRRTKEGRNSKVVYVGARRRAGSRLRLGFTRSAEYPFLVPLRKILRDEGIELDFQVYENGVGVARDLSQFRIDIGIAPLVTLFMMHSLDAPFKILAPAGSGGSSVLRSPKTSSTSRASEGLKAISTRMSTMEVLMRSAESHHAIPEIGVLTYARGPLEIENAMMSGSVDVCSLWEPYATMLEAQGAKRILRYSEMSEHICCAAAAGNHLGERTVSKLSAGFAASMDVLRRDNESQLSAYAALAGLESSMVRRVQDDYSYPVAFSVQGVVDQFRSVGMTVPSPASFKDALLRDQA